MILKSIFLSLGLVSALAQASFQVTTYNVGLADGFVALAKERIDPIIEELKKAQTDILCLNEVWSAADRNKIINELKSIYPHSHYTEVEQLLATRKPVCRATDLFGKGKFASCVLKECRGLEGSDFTQCVTSVCGPALRALQGEKRQCANALMAQVGESTARSLMRVLSPLRRAGLFAYGGGNGLLILSRIPMKDKALVDLTDLSSLNRRAALKVETEQAVVYCAHLSSDLTTIAPYTGRFNNWEEENQAQVKALIEDSSKISKPIVMMGDFNCSPDFPELGIKPTFERSCELFTEAGFMNSYISQGPDCTFCEDNTIIANNPNEEGGELLDHIFTKGILDSYVERVFDDVKSIPVGGNQTVQSHLSDHFGLQMEIVTE
jgi:endonuclease/exonuclease/phosphatase family metal-dependent hydrolase